MTKCEEMYKKIGAAEKNERKCQKDNNIDMCLFWGNVKKGLQIKLDKMEVEELERQI